MRNFLKRLWSWLRLLLKGCAWLIIALVVALVFMREYFSWFGTRHWVAVQEMLARQGESLDLHKIAPDPVPDDQNFCAIPALKDLALSTGTNDAGSDLGMKLKRLVDAGLPKGLNVTATKPKLSQGASFGKATDMTAWADWLRKDGSLPVPPDSGNPAGDVLAGLSKNDTLISELALGLSRPESQWTPPWKTRDFPENLFPVPLPMTQYEAAQALTLMLCLRGVAAARAGDAAKAHQSLLIALRINQAFMKEPFPIASLVACGESAVITGAVWELCDAHSGTVEDFRTLQEELSRLDYHASYLCAERGELELSEKASAYVKRARDVGGDLGQFPMVLHLTPDGWLDANEATITQWHFDYFVKPLRDAGFNELLTKQRELEALVAEHKRQWYMHPDEVLALIALPAMAGVTHRVIYAQSLVNEAIAACALERYRIEHNAYPDTLEAANRPGEKSIPLDIISGKPMGYRKTPDGRYTLWCVAFNGKDHGGKRVLDTENPEHTNFSDPNYSGDWVWDFPAK